MIEEKSLTCPQCGRRFAEPADRCDADGSPLYGPEVMQRLGLQLNNYKIHSILGEGGMGVVYRGEHAMLGKPVAIKVLHDRFARREGALEQFLREAQAASRIRHPNIVDVTDFGEAPDGSVYFVMEFLEGESLEDVLARRHRIELFNAVNIVRQIARALAAAHDNGVVHLDLKPENVYLINREGRRRIVRRIDSADDLQFVVENEGRFDWVKLLDFGVAKFIHENLGPGLGTRAGMVFGTPHYMSPEQARGEKVDGRSDIYSLGVLFYEMILGDVPFDGDAAIDILNGHVSGKVIPPRECHPSIDVDENTNHTILKCLEKDPNARYQTMDQLVESLQACFTDRVFLRDAHLMPGAVEAGIVPQAASDRAAATADAERRAPRARKRSRQSHSLTEELAELFSKRSAERRSAGGGDDSEDLGQLFGTGGETAASDEALAEGGPAAQELRSPRGDPSHGLSLANRAAASTDELPETNDKRRRASRAMTLQNPARPKRRRDDTSPGMGAVPASRPTAPGIGAQRAGAERAGASRSTVPRQDGTADDGGSEGTRERKRRITAPLVSKE